MTDIQGLFDLLTKGTSGSHVTAWVGEKLKRNGFKKLSIREEWDIEKGGKYFVGYGGSSLMAFAVGKDYQRGDGLRLGACHTDFPCFKVKPNPEIVTKGYGKLNLEAYGGGIWNTWMDRPLSVAGRVALKSQDVFAPRIEYVDFDRPLMTIPNLAIHMNREVNKGIELNKQTDLQPVLQYIKEEKDGSYFMELLAGKLSVKPEDILDYELTVYCREEPCLMGAREEYISSPRLDNLTSAYGLTEGLINGLRERGINGAAYFDHEEIGSRTKQGAASLLLRDVLTKILRALGEDEQSILSSFYNSMLLSLDVAHGLHPNQTGKMDLTNQPVLNEGFCIKESSVQTYATDCEAIAIIQQICESQSIPYQKFVNRSDLTGGSTLGAIASTLLPIPTVDMGVPILAMHSAREFMGRRDMESLNGCIRSFFQL
ncbi:MAG: M18 family aminopeptidase [Roseburia sp.]|nr:M18 family aminopeptidase [Roseburia sp.]